MRTEDTGSTFELPPTINMGAPAVRGRKHIGLTTWRKPLGRKRIFYKDAIFDGHENYSPVTYEFVVVTLSGSLDQAVGTCVRDSVIWVLGTERPSSAGIYA